MKSKLLALLLAGLMVAAFVGGCGGTDTVDEDGITTHTIVGLFPRPK